MIYFQFFILYSKYLTIKITLTRTQSFQFFILYSVFYGAEDPVCVSTSFQFFILYSPFSLDYSIIEEYIDTFNSLYCIPGITEALQCQTYTSCPFNSLYCIRQRGHQVVQRANIFQFFILYSPITIKPGKTHLIIFQFFILYSRS